MSISFDEFDQSIKLISDLVYETELVHYKDNPKNEGGKTSRCM